MDLAQKVSFVSLLENIEVEPERPRAEVVVNSNTGTIVIGGDVRISPAAVTHGSLTVKVEEDVQVTQARQLLAAPEMGQQLLQMVERLPTQIHKSLLQKIRRVPLFLIRVSNYHRLWML